MNEHELQRQAKHRLVILGTAPGSVDSCRVRIWSSLEGSHHAQGISCGVPS